MKRQETTNTFQEGMIMDLNPLTTPNNVVTNCLNGTLLTFNGNEYVLQNDMGNGRVETAYLPEGYVPLGTTELGGIIYIVSYNPLNGRCQIGSFPSPERNIESDENPSSATVTLSNKDFGCVIEDNTLKKPAKVYYIKKQLAPGMTFYPGDKFIVSGNSISDNIKIIQGIDGKYNLTKKSGEIVENEELKDPFNCIFNETIRLYLGIITSDGKLTTLTNLKKFKIGSYEGKDCFYEISNNTKDEETSTDYDDYKTLVSQPYNIYNSKLSGELVVIAELVQCTSFDVSFKHNLRKDKIYIPEISFTFGGGQLNMPYGVIANYTIETDSKQMLNIYIPEVHYRCDNLKYDAEKEVYTESIDSSNSTESIKPTESEDLVKCTLPKDITENIRTILNDPDKPKGILKYTFTPCMNWGPLDYLSVEGSIDLQKIGTGEIELTTWRYYNTDKECRLQWGLNTYLKENQTIKSVEFRLSRFAANDKWRDYSRYQIDAKPSYHGTWDEEITFDINLPNITLIKDKISDNKDYKSNDNDTKILSNNLYLVDVFIITTENGEDKGEVLKQRWLHTSPVLNDYYNKVLDFDDVRYKVKPTFDTEIQVTQNSPRVIFKGDGQKIGTLQKKLDSDEEQNKTILDSLSSLSAIQSYEDIILSCQGQLKLKKDYNSFRIQTQRNVKKEVDQEGIEWEVYDKTLCVKASDPELSVSSDMKSTTPNMDINSETYLENKIVDWPNSTLTDKTTSQDIIDNCGNSIKLNNSDISITSNHNLKFNDKTNEFTFETSISLSLLVKAYCTKKSETIQYSGVLKPLCYDSKTFAKYNLVFDDKSLGWKPSKLGTYSWHKHDEKVNCKIGILYNDNLSDPSDDYENQTQYKREDRPSINFGTDEDIVDAEISWGWNSSTTIFATQYGQGAKGSLIVYRPNIIKNTGWISSIEARSRNFSKDLLNKSMSNAYTLVILMMQSDQKDKRFYPINFCKNGGSERGTDKLPIGELVHNKKDFFDLSGSFGELYMRFANVLNNIYKYTPNSFVEDWAIIDNIYWGDNYKYNMSVSINISPNLEENKTNICIKLENGDYLPLATYNKEYPHLNVQPDINYKTLETHLNVIHQKSNPLYRIFEDTKVNKFNNIVIFDFDGKTVIGSTNQKYETNILYCRDTKLIPAQDTNPDLIQVYSNIVEANMFMPILLTYEKDGTTKLPPNKTKCDPLYYDDYEFGTDNQNNGTITSNLQRTQNLNNCYTLNEQGYLVIKAADRQGQVFTREGGPGGLVTGYQNMGFGNKFKAWVATDDE